MTTFRKQIQDRISDNKEALGLITVGGRDDLTDFLASNSSASLKGLYPPAAFVWRERCKAGPNELLGSARQRVASRIVITVAIAHQKDVIAEDQAEVISDEIWNLLAGWNNNELLFDEGILAKEAEGIYCWSNYFITKNWKQENR